MPAAAVMNQAPSHSTLPACKLRMPAAACSVAGLMIDCGTHKVCL